MIRNLTNKSISPLDQICSIEDDYISLHRNTGAIDIEIAKSYFENKTSVKDIACKYSYSPQTVYDKANLVRSFIESHKYYANVCLPNDFYFYVPSIYAHNIILMTFSKYQSTRETFIARQDLLSHISSSLKNNNIVLDSLCILQNAKASFDLPEKSNPINMILQAPTDGPTPFQIYSNVSYENGKLSYSFSGKMQNFLELGILANLMKP